MSFSWGAGILDALGGRDLPVAGALPRVTAALEASRVLVVEAPPGTGKTALVPAAVAAWQAARGIAPRVWCTQPRRVAARAAAGYAAQLVGARVGGEVGYTVRGEHRAGADTALDFCTAGVAVRRLAGDPFAQDATAIVLDEVHERSLDTDLACAFAAEAASVRDDLWVVAMSATLDAGRFAELLGGEKPAPIVRVEAETHPLEVTLAPPPRGVSALDGRGVTWGFLDHIAGVAAREVDREAGDVLVFVPGAREVDRVSETVRQLAPGHEVAPLHGRLPFAAQKRALTRHDGSTRVVVSTSLAESALTIPGVRCVVDAGLAREPRYDVARAMSGLVTVAESKASATQRAGRAAREAAGRAIRCFDQATWPRLAAYPQPESAVSDLADAVLTLAAWGAPAGQGIRLVEDFPEAARIRAVDTLRGLGAVDSDGAITPLGRRIQQVPADPRLARALLEGAGTVGAKAAGEAVAMLADPPREDDLARALSRLRRGHDAASQTWRDQAKRMARLAGEDAAERAQAPTLSGDDALAWICALAYPERIARRRGEAAQGARSLAYAFAGGTGAALPATSPLAGAEWLTVAEVTHATGTLAAESGAIIRSGIAIDEQMALEAGRHLITEDVVTSVDAGRARAQRVRRLGAIELARHRATPDAASVERCVAAAIAADRIVPPGDTIIPWSPAATELRDRLAMLHDALGAPWPDVSRQTLTVDAAQWLAPAWQALAASRVVTSSLIMDCLRGLLPWPEAARLDELTPMRIPLPSGRSAAVEYGPDGPVIRAKLQECFGWADNPRVADGRVLVVVDLLDPAGRVVAHTGDLKFFWAEAYPQVRAEKRGRYPKHPWPEDPWNATPTARTNRRQ